MNSFEISGIRFDIPTKEDLTSWNYKEWKESRTTFREIWVDNYIKEGLSFCRNSYCLQMKNGSTITMDGKKLKDKDFENAKKIFEIIDEVNR